MNLKLDRTKVKEAPIKDAFVLQGQLHMRVASPNGFMLVNLEEGTAVKARTRNNHEVILR